MIIYIAAYPIHSFLLPIYSFWNMDNFTWGNTRIVLDEKNGKKVVIMPEDEKFNPSAIQWEPWSSYANRTDLPGAERPIVFNRKGRIIQETDVPEMGYDMDDLPGVNELRDTQRFVSPTLRESVISQSPVGGSLLFENRNTFMSERLSNPFASRFSMNTDIASGMGAARMSVATDLSAFTGLQPTIDEDTLAAVRQAVKSSLAEADMDNTTKRQLRERVVAMLEPSIVSRVPIVAIDELIDDELENIADDDVDEVKGSHALDGESN
jgi:chitin synthase